MLEQPPAPLLELCSGDAHRNTLCSVSEPIDQLRATVAAVPPAPDAMAGYLRKVHERAYTVVDGDVESH